MYVAATALAAVRSIRYSKNLAGCTTAKHVHSTWYGHATFVSMSKLKTHEFNVTTNNGKFAASFDWNTGSKSKLSLTSVCYWLYEGAHAKGCGHFGFFPLKFSCRAHCNQPVKPQDWRLSELHGEEILEHAANRFLVTIVWWWKPTWIIQRRQWGQI